MSAHGRERIIFLQQVVDNICSDYGANELLWFLTIYTKQGGGGSWLGKEIRHFVGMQQYCPALILLSKTLFVTSENHRENITTRVGILRMSKKNHLRPLKDGDAVQSTFIKQISHRHCNEIKVCVKRFIWHRSTLKITYPDHFGLCTKSHAR